MDGCAFGVRNNSPGINLGLVRRVLDGFLAVLGLDLGITETRGLPVLSLTPFKDGIILLDGSPYFKETNGKRRTAYSRTDQRNEGEGQCIHAAPRAQEDFEGRRHRPNLPKKASTLEAHSQKDEANKMTGPFARFGKRIGRISLSKKTKPGIGTGKYGRRQATVKTSMVDAFIRMFMPREITLSRPPFYRLFRKGKTGC